MILVTAVIKSHVNINLIPLIERNLVLTFVEGVSVPPLESLQNRELCVYNYITITLTMPFFYHLFILYISKKGPPKDDRFSAGKILFGCCAIFSTASSISFGWCGQFLKLAVKSKFILTLL